MDMNKFSLEGKVALVTGSSRGIGRGIADLLTKEGWTVVYSGTKKERPLDLPDSIDYFPCDISKTEDRQAAVQYVASHYGRFDLLVNNAGVAPLERRDLLDMTEESFDRVVGINLKGTLFMTQLAAREMLREKEAGIKDWGPHIVNIGSMSAYTSSISRGEYCVSKAGVGMVTIGASPIDQGRARDFFGSLSVCRDTDIPGLHRLVEEVHRYGAALSCEILHAGRIHDPVFRLAVRVVGKIVVYAVIKIVDHLRLLHPFKRRKGKRLPKRVLILRQQQFQHFPHSFKRCRCRGPRRNGQRPPLSPCKHTTDVLSSQQKRPPRLLRRGGRDSLRSSVYSLMVKISLRGSRVEAKALMLSSSA